MKRISRNSKCFFEPFFIVKSIQGVPQSHFRWCLLQERRHPPSCKFWRWWYILHIARKVLNILWSIVVCFSIWIQEIVLDSFWISIRVFYTADKNNFFCSFSLSLSSIMQTIHKKKGKKTFYRIKLDKAQISRKKWTHTLHAMLHFCLI